MNELHHFTRLLGYIPGTLWAVVVGSLLTLAGVYFTNRANDLRLKVEREMTFRKETYAVAAEAISVSISTLAKFSDLSFSLREISEAYLEKFPVLAKVNLVAGEDTLRALASFGAEFAGAVFRLTLQRRLLTDLQEQIAVKAASLRGFEKTRDAMIELMRHHNIDGIQDSRRFEAIRENFDFEAGRITTTSQGLQQMVAELSAKQIPFAKECSIEAARLNRLTIPLVVAARMELDLSVSKERYSEILHQSLSKHEVQLDEFIQNVAAANAEVQSS